MNIGLPTQVSLDADASDPKLHLTINGEPYSQPTVFNLSGSSLTVHSDTLNTIDVQFAGSPMPQVGSLTSGICLAAVPPLNTVLTPGTSMAISVNGAEGQAEPQQVLGGPLVLSVYNTGLAHLTVLASGQPVSIAQQSSQDFPLGHDTIQVVCNSSGHATVTLTTSDSQEPVTVTGELRICITPNTSFTLRLQESLRLRFLGLGAGRSSLEDEGRIHPLNTGVKCADDTLQPLG